MATALHTITTSPVSPPRIAVDQRRFTEQITSVFGPVDTTITEWAPIHGDMGFANLTMPPLVILDWEDFGTGPAMLDYARVWADSFAAPAIVTEQCEAAFAPYLVGWQGLLCRACAVAGLLRYPATEPLLQAAAPVTEKIATELRSSSNPG
ncbi:Phosphotransferase enzyme family protein [Saccharopolyspora antimicrobica]|uniref:Phosphotransferase enzyme family protein n=1 Tax=Saccharopolyspora antimicrobica TaxID=455193 RepID=A0A1I4XND5_9PSEU|nr:phosphotransferase [Saccharopolyspora antimicrobica]SFN27136.1 Phosphotransferase enzyme family protein [Saccharopolyspora antimicrobica]